MDFCSVDSELIESLDFLRPPVARVIRSTNRSTATNLCSHNNNINVLKDFSKNITRDSQFTTSKIRGVESSTSLILKKTSDREILKQYSVLSYTNLAGARLQNPKIFPTSSPVSKDRPFIRVTVIPKTDPTRPTLGKRKHIPKRIHTTVSNQENSIQTKNVYLVVQSRKREKVYEIKTTGSAKFPKNRSKDNFKDEVVPLEQLSSLKLVLDSLNMDKDREKDRRRRKRANDVEDFMAFSGVVNGNEKYRECTCLNPVRGYEKFRECTCPNEFQGGPSDVADRKSRVRITGQLGLNGDDRYVLKCAATVNDKPVATDFRASEHVAPQMFQKERRFFDVCDRETCLTRCYNAATYCTQKRDFNIQADLQNENKSEMPSKPPIMLSKESQATQVNFNDDIPKFKTTFPNKDEIIQCCRTNVDNYANLTDSDSDSNSLKACQSPLVIISVYPMQDCCENVVSNSQNDIKCSPPRKQNIFGHSSKRSNSRTRPIHENKVDNKPSKPRSRSPSPQNKNISKSNVEETRILRTNSRKSSPRRDVNSSLTKSSRQTRINQENQINVPKSRQRFGSPPVKSSKESKGINTEHNVTKKQLVDSYTKQLTDYLKSEKGEINVGFPKMEPSKVTINIDGDKEYYDVLFQQEHSTTDLKVRKTVKGSHTNKKLSQDVKDTSPMKNLLLIHEETKRRSPTQTKNQQRDKEVNKTFSRLQVRDSLEISHRRDYKLPVDQAAKNKQKSRIIEDIGQFSAPIKHYRGDSCTISDPIKRDKEIRALLGVDKGVHTSVTRVLEVEENNFAVPLHYFYGKTCEKKIVTGINIMEMPDPPCACCDIQKFYSDTSDYGIQPQPQPYDETYVKTKSVHSTIRVSSQQNKKVNASSHQIDQEMAQYEPPSSDSASPEDEQAQSPVEESPSPLEESPLDESPSPIEEYPSPLVERAPTKRHMSKTTKKSRANSTGTQYETQVRRTSLYQQLILNRNIQVFLQVEQFSKQKPIILSRKQYDKVKRTIESTIANKAGRDYKRKKCICKTSLVSVGDIRKKTKTGQSLRYDDKQDQTDKQQLVNNSKKSSSMSNKSRDRSSRRIKSKPVVLFTTELKDGEEKKATVITPRQAMSSINIQYASMSLMKRVDVSSTKVEAGSMCQRPLQRKDSHSIHTIFKGHRKCPTPNLGTSVYSLYSDVNNELIPEKPVLMPLESKQKKPFLRRLMSCLVMRSAKVSELHNIVSPPVKDPSIASSLDSYHISTSLGAIEVSSSIYDTSASFYSNHSVYPVNSKMKRGFFSSVREFLTNRKS